MPLARLKPYSKGEGHLLRRLMVGPQLFVGDRGWYKVSDAVAEQLRKVRQPIPPGGKGPLTPPAFDIVDERGAAEIERAEREAREQRAGYENPIEVGNDLSTADLRGTVEIQNSPDIGSSPGASRRRRSTRSR